MSKTTFYPLIVKEIKRETADTVSIVLSVPEHLKSAFAYKQGQYLTFKYNEGKEELRRSYSICSNPYIGEDLRVAVKKIESGKFSSYAVERLQVGDTLETLPPEGNFFTELRSNQQKSYIAVAAGSGITPIFSILKSVLSQEPESRFLLLYINRTPKEVIFKSELQALEEKQGGRLQVIYYYSRHTMSQLPPIMEAGRLDASKWQALCAFYPQLSKGDEYFLCGPYEMVEMLRHALQGQSVPAAHIHYELFTPPPATAGETNTIATASGESLLSEVSVIIDDETTTFLLASDGKNILDAALDENADLPYACKGAVCCTCRAKVLEGKVLMTKNHALSADEVAAGFILTCQSHPLTPRVCISFDEV